MAGSHCNCRVSCALRSAQAGNALCMRCSYDPNYGKVIKLPLDLPYDPLYAPCLCLYAL